ncbi:excinuclease ABC subunit UvrC [Gudongella sp. DL1XJH-153]|uniref:excinuclease ABC subunit UvrC n=1 Tax=Gudongella sp. DL1XJH-153 TaxID=3409804 RepID=UPI003BB7A814
MSKFEEQLKNLPDSPGVYLMKDKAGEIIYVGKANSLKKRVRQYFQSSANHSLKVSSMVKQIGDFEYIMVENEVEALVLESNLIKKNRPKYNILLRDDKQYPYIKVTLGERYPRVLKTRLVVKDGSKYFGPYPSASSVNEAIEVFHGIFPIRNCKLDLDKKDARFRPCLNFYIGRCLGPCLGNVDEDLYKGMIQKILDFLSMKDESIIDDIEVKMKAAADNMDYEKAAALRDQLQALQTLHEKQRMDSASNVEQDIIAMARGVEEVVVQVFFIREGKIVGREHYIMEDSFIEERGEILSSFIKQFYPGSTFIPKEILVEEEVPDLEAIQQWLGEIKGNKVSLQTPKRGDKLEIVRMVKRNALEMLDKYGDKFLRKHRENLKGLDELQHILELEERPERIEAYDISNISGVGSVGSMIVYEKGEKKKSDYRRFKIKTRTTPDDYGSMEEILKRRFVRGIKENNDTERIKGAPVGFSLFPDIIMVDGGKGHVNKARAILDELGVDIPVCGLVKDKFHKTRGIIYKNNEITPEKDSLAFKLIYAVQEEAHRFAISYHRSLRSKDLFHSELDGIPLIGEKRRVVLLKHFGSISGIKNASLDELAQVDGMNKSAAKSVYEHFRKKEEK